ncbi:hypothetical protein SAY87_010463 [Trapa incisa]|nr:hypothetical protein SAY87_010463 [Trapa incisa]
MTQLLAKSLDGPFSILVIILSLVVLDLVLIIRDFYSNLTCFVLPILRFLFTSQRSLFCSCEGKNLDVSVKCQHPQLLSIHEVKLSGEDATLVMEMLGIFCTPEGDGWPHKDIDATEIAGLFNEREPSLDEVKEAFNVFDRNSDGFIDAIELCSFLRSFGFLRISEEDCRGMIRAFDDNCDSVIDLREFIKLVEKIQY